MRAFLVSIRFVAGVCLLLLFHTSTWVQAQINESDGLRAPGDWNSWTNTLNMGGDFDLARSTSGLLRWTTTFQYTGTTGSVSFKFASSGASGVWHNQWSGHAFTMDAVNSVGYGDFGNNTVDLVQNNYYTIVFKDNGYATTDVSLMETSVAPVSVSSSSRATAVATNPGPGQDVTINVTLSAAKSGDERVYLIYTTDSWASRDYVEVTNFSGTTSGSAVIPGQSASTTINYYVMTSTMDLNGVAANETDYDLRSIAIGGSGTYDVAASWTTAASPTSWSAASSWDAGAVPDASTPVTIGQSLTLDADVTVSNLTINSGATLTASDGTNRTLTIASGGAIANNGSFAASSGKVSFAGSGSVTGTIAFNDVSLSGGGVNFGLSSTVNGTMEILSGGYVDTNPPTYGASSTLKYNPGVNFGVGTEWNSPHHVTVSSGTELDFNASAARSCSGNVTIDAGGHLNMDVMEAALTVAGNVAINGILSMSTLPGGDLEVGGNFELASGGTFNENDRALDFNGAGAQAINGPELTLKYMIVEKQTGTLTLNTPLNIEPGGILWPTQGAMNLNGNALTMRSDATGTAVVGEVGGTVTGNITFERYVPENDNDATSFVNLSSYVSGINASNWTGAGANYVFEYDETNLGGINDGWVATTGELTVGKGYMAQFPGAAGVTLSCTGALTSGDQAVSVTHSAGTSDNGWNLVGNPYPCSVNFADLTWSGTAPAGFYVWDEDAGGYTQEPVTGAIGVGQSFWVQVGASQTLTFTESAKTTASNPFVRSADEWVVFALRASEPNGHWSRGIRVMDPNASAAFDPSCDLRTLGDPMEEERIMVWFETADNESVSVLATHPDDASAVPVQLLTQGAGTCFFDLDPAFGIPEGTCLTLQDTWTGNAYTLTDSTVVAIELEPHTHYADRFVLGSEAQPDVAASSTWCDGGQVVLGWDAAEAAGWTVAWTGPSTGEVSGESSFSGLPAGDYELTWEHEGGVCAGATSVEVLGACQGDFTGDGHRGSPDLLGLLASIQPSPPPAALSQYDCDCDGALAIGDVLSFLSVFGLSCNPEE